MGRKKNNRKGENKMTNEFVNEEIEQVVQTNGEENIETENNDTIIEAPDTASEELVNEILKNQEVEGKDEVTPEEPEKPQVDPEDEIKPTFVVEGTVTGCKKLNVRAEASKESQAIYILEKDASVMVDQNASTEDFYKIYTMDIEGYCVKEFISIK